VLDGRVIITELEEEPEGIELGEVTVTKVVVDEPPLIGTEEDPDTEIEDVEEVEVTIAVELTPVLVGTLVGIEVGGW
jgi:hypothetical protein